MRSPAVLASASLVVGLAVGIAIAASGSPALRTVADVLEPVGALWVNAIRMTVVPLVLSLLVATLASRADAGAVGRQGARLVMIFLALLVGVAALGMLVGPAVFGRLRVDPAAAASLQATAGRTADTAQLPTFTSWLESIIPANPVRAAVDGTMLPVIAFALIFGLALARADAARRANAANLFRAVAEACLVIVRWVLVVSPIGVFALAVTVAVRTGASIAGVVAFYLVGHVALLVLTGALLYLLVRVATGVPLGRFARAVLPAQVVALSARSSVAALPALIDGAERVLGMPKQIASFALPFGVSVFRLNQGVSWVVCGLFIGKLYGIELGLAQVATLAAAAVGFSFSIPGVPSAGLFILAPIFMAVRLPVEGIGILIALDAIPDMFKTAVNVTGHMTGATLVWKRSGNDPAERTPSPKSDVR
jgi:Na+/H+-dicarboxylate symporter